MAKRKADFSARTKDLLAGRAGYKCSHPDCRHTTIGASAEGNNKTSSIGEAAHICAASPGGKRYDATMTDEERSSIDNGIWLCKTHARLIDTDETTYTVDLLKEWKRIAEFESLQNLCSLNTIDRYFEKNSDDILVLADTLERCITEGEFKILSFLLSTYTCRLTETYDELILRYRIKYAVYCDRASLNGLVNDYLSIKNKKGIDEIIELFIIFDMKDLLLQVLEYCNSMELKELAELSINDNLSSSFIASKREKELIAEVSENSSNKYKNHSKCINKFLSLYIYSTKQVWIQDIDGNQVELYHDDFLFNIINVCFELERDSCNPNESNFTDLISVIKANMNKINSLDLILQLLLLQPVLNALLSGKYEKTDAFSSIFELISKELRQEKEIVKINYLFQINNKKKTNIDDIIRFCEDNNDYLVLKHYLVNQDNDSIVRFLDDHAFLYGRDVDFISIRYDASKNGINTILKKYSNEFEGYFIFACIQALEGDASKADWLVDNCEDLTLNDCMPYVNVLKMYKKYSDLATFYKHIIHDPRLNSVLFRVAIILQENPTTISNAYEIYTTLAVRGFATKGMYINMGIIEEQNGNIESAKKSYSKEYDDYETEEALFRLILIRYNNKQFYKDKYLEKAKKYTLNAKMLELVGATLEELNESNFIDFFIRSLLIDDSNSQLLKHIFIPLNELSSADDPKSVGENTVCTLSNGQDLFVAIHRSEVINGITPCDLGNCKHFSVDEPIVAQLMFRTVGEKVSFFENEYEIKNIESIYRFFSRLSMNHIITDPTFIKISGNIEDSIEQLTEITKQQSDAIKDKVDLYNDSAVPLPFSFLSSIIAKPKIETIDFLLHQNKKRICNNNNNFPAEPIKWYVLSFDAIIVLHKLGIFNRIKNYVNFCCTQQVKNELINEIGNDISEIKSKTGKGYLSYINGKLNMVEYDDSAKRSMLTKYLELQSIVNCITVLDNIDYRSENHELNEIIIKEKWFCESTSLAAVYKNEDMCLVTDDLFISQIANADKSKCIGVCNLISKMDASINELIDIIKKLYEMNYLFYFSTTVLKKSFDIIAQNGNKQDDYDTLFCFLKSNETNGVSSKIHSQAMLYLIQDFAKKEKTIFLQHHELLEIYAYHYKLLYPEKFNEIVNNAINSIFGGNASNLHSNQDDMN